MLIPNLCTPSPFNRWNERIANAVNSLWPNPVVYILPTPRFPYLRAITAHGLSRYRRRQRSACTPHDHGATQA